MKCSRCWVILSECQPELRWKFVDVLLLTGKMNLDGFHLSDSNPGVNETDTYCINIWGFYHQRYFIRMRFPMMNSVVIKHFHISNLCLFVLKVVWSTFRLSLVATVPNRPRGLCSHQPTRPALNPSYLFVCCCVFITMPLRSTISF